jgi:ammonium transporter, Amt family
LSAPNPVKIARMSGSWLVICVAALLLRVGISLYLAGIARSKNTIASLFRSIVEIAVGVLAYWLFGGAILAGSWHRLANPDPTTGLFFAAAFLIGPAVISGAVLERGRASVGIAASVLIPGVLAPLLMRLLRADWLIEHGFVDAAGGVFIHFSAGLAALLAALIVGPRIGKYNRDGSTNAILGHNLPLASFGVLLIFVIWIPYVVGFAPGATSALNTLLAGAAGIVASVLYCYIRYGRSDVFLIYAGLLGALVSITAGADRLPQMLAVVTGAVAGVLVPYAVVKLDLVWKIDDPAGGIAIHGLGGLWSALAVALLAPGTLFQRIGRLEFEIVGLAMAAGITLAVCGLVFYALRATVGVRVTEPVELEGLDLAEHDLNAYPDFQQTMIKSYHLREM